MPVIFGIAFLIGALLVVGELMSGKFDASSVLQGNGGVPTSLTSGLAVDASAVASSVTSALANAIAKAEGFFVPGALPNRTNNPGDLMVGSVGNGTQAGKTVFSSAADGWQALYNQVELMLTGQSQYYDPSMTISQVAKLYTGADNAAAWASTVASELSVTPDTTLAQLQAGA